MGATILVIEKIIKRLSLFISEFAKKSGVSIHTLRYYDAADLEWMIWVKRLKVTGMSLANIKQFAQLRLQGDDSLLDRKQMLAEHAEHLKKDIEQLRHELTIVENKITDYEKKALELE